MKKLFQTKLLMAIVLSTIIIFSSCSEKIALTDLEFSPTINHTVQGGIYPNSSVPVRILLAGADITTRDVKVTYNGATGGTGVLSLENNGATFETGTSTTHKFSNPLSLKFQPTSSGQVTLTFTLTYGNTEKKAVLSLLVSPAAYSIQINEKPDSICIGDRKNMKMVVIEDEAAIKASMTKAGGNKFKLRAEMIKGSGILQIKDKILIATASKVMEAIGMKVSGKTEVEVGKNEEVAFFYTPLSAAENKIAIYIEDEYGNTVNQSTSFIATPPPVNIKSTISKDSVYISGSINAFYVSFENQEQSNDNTYTLDWSYNTKSPSQDLLMVLGNGGMWPIGQTVQFDPNKANAFMFTSSSKNGVAYVDFKLTDKYGTQTRKTDTITSKAQDLKYSLSIPNTISLQTYVARQFVGTISAPTATTNKYNLVYNINKPDGLRLSIDGKIYTPGTKIELPQHQQQFEVIADSAGTYIVDFIVTDSYDKDNKQKMTITSTTAPIGSTFTPPAQINYGNSAPMQFVLPTNQSHIESYKGKIDFDEGHGAEISINGQNITPSVEFPLKKGSNSWTIKPNKINKECAFALVVKTNLGQEEHKHIVIPVTFSPLTATITSIRSEVDLTQTLLYNLTTAAVGYTDILNIEVRQLKGVGDLYIAGKKVANLSSTTIPKPNVTSLSFQATAIGDIEVELRISDKYEQTQTVMLRGKVTQAPFSATLTTTVSEVKYLTATPLILNISQPLFTGDYTVTATSSNGGSIKLNGKDQKFDTGFPLKNGTHNIEFTPSNCGETTINFAITDGIAATTINAPLKFEVKPYPLIVEVANQSKAEVDRNESVTFDLKVDEELAAVTPYIFKYSMGQGTGVLVLSNNVVASNTAQNLTKGNHTFTYTPTSSGQHTINMLVKDMFGQEKNVVVNVQANHNKLVATSTPLVNVYVNNAGTIDLNVDEERYTGSFQVKYSGGTGTLSNSGAVITQNTFVNIAKGKNSLSYTPTTTGSHNLVFTFKDAFTQTVVTNTRVEATFAEIVATPSASAITTNPNKPTSFTLNVSEKGYAADFTLTCSGSIGTINVNGVALSSTGNIVASGVSTITYTPTTTGVHPLVFTVTDKNGQSKTATIQVTVEHVPMTFAGSIAPTTTVNTASALALTTSGAAPIKVKYSGGAGVLKRANSAVMTLGTDYDFTGSEQLTYTPSTTGVHSLNFTATDKNGQTRSFTISTLAEHVPMTFNATASTSGFIHRPTTITLTTSGAAPVKVKYNGGTGALNLPNGAPVTPNTDITMETSNVWSFTPSTTGVHTLNFTATDKNGQTMTKVVTINTQNPIVTATLSNPTSTVLWNYTATTNLTIQSSAGNEMYRIANITGLMENGQPKGTTNFDIGTQWSSVNAGNISAELKFTAKTVGSHLIEIELMDKYDAKTVIRWVVNVDYAEITASLSGSTEAVVHNNSQFDLSITKQDYQGNFKVELSSNASGTFATPTFTGSLGQNTFTYKPTVTGSHTITAKITALADNKTKTVQFVVNTSIPPFVVNLENNSKFFQDLSTNNPGMGGAAPDIPVYSNPILSSDQTHISFILGIAKRLYLPSDIFEVKVTSPDASYDSRTDALTLYNNGWNFVFTHSKNNIQYFEMKTPITITIVDCYNRKITRDIYLCSYKRM